MVWVLARQDCLSDLDPNWMTTRPNKDPKIRKSCLPLSYPRASIKNSLNLVYSLFWFVNPNTTATVDVLSKNPTNQIKWNILTRETLQQKYSKPKPPLLCPKRNLQKSKYAQRRLMFWPYSCSDHRHRATERDDQTRTANHKYIESSKLLIATKALPRHTDAKSPLEDQWELTGHFWIWC